MDKGILNQPLLEKNIEKLEFYSLEENKILSNIEKHLKESCKSYNSPNTSLFINNNRNLYKDINFIYKKRTSYTTILRKMIVKYNALSNETIQIFENGGNL